MSLFIAVDLPDETRKELEKSMKEFHPFLEGSWVKPENMHLTIRFLGEADQKTAELVKERLSGKPIRGVFRGNSQYPRTQVRPFQGRISLVQSCPQ